MTQSAVQTVLGKWQALSLRERVLAFVAALIAAGLGLQVLVYRPLMAAHADAARAEAAAQALLRQVRADAAEAKALQALARQQDRGRADGSVRQLAGQGARRHGIRIARLRPGNDGGLTVWVDAVRAPTLTQWLIELRRQHGISVGRADLSRADEGGMIAARVHLMRGEDT